MSVVPRKMLLLQPAVLILRDYGGCAVNRKGLTEKLLFIRLPEWRKLSLSPWKAGATANV